MESEEELSYLWRTNPAVAERREKFPISKEALEAPNKPNDYEYWMHHFNILSSARQIAMSIYSIPWNNIWEYINVFFEKSPRNIKKKYLEIFLELDMSYVNYQNEASSLKRK